MTTKFKARTWFYKLPAIEEVEIDRETDKSVWINGRRRDKETGDCIYADTWEEAKSFMLKHIRREYESAAHRLTIAEEKLNVVANLRK